MNDEVNSCHTLEEVIKKLLYFQESYTPIGYIYFHSPYIGKKRQRLEKDII